MVELTRFPIPSLVLGDQLPAPPHEREQNVEGTLPERDRNAVRQELAPCDQQTKWTELQSVGIGHCYAGSFEAASAGRNLRVSRLRPLRCSYRISDAKYVRDVTMLTR